MSTTIRSTPSPSPPAGGMPTRSACKKSASSVRAVLSSASVSLNCSALGRIAGLEAIALSLIAQGETLVRLRPEPEMRGYLAAALKNSLKRRDKFPPTWVRRLTALLETLGAEHIDLMRRIAKVSKSGTVDETQEWWMRLKSGDDGVVASELAARDLVVFPRGFSGLPVERLAQ